MNTIFVCALVVVSFYSGVIFAFQLVKSLDRKADEIVKNLDTPFSKKR